MNIPGDSIIDLMRSNNWKTENYTSGRITVFTHERYEWKIRMVIHDETSLQHFFDSLIAEFSAFWLHVGKESGRKEIQSIIRGALGIEK